ncbi:MAG: ribosome silencing factor [Actinomycetota bacterium]|nr:ribosome silencing factor [Actinomycetota bacterium]
MGEVLVIAEKFVVTSASNHRLVKTLVEEVQSQVAASHGRKPLRVEGLDSLEWVLVDYGDVVVHVFGQETREFYDLERLFGDVPQVAWGEPAAPVSGRAG